MKASLQIPAHLHLICRKCTREAGFEGTPEAAKLSAEAAGWIVETGWVGGPNFADPRNRVVCPTCPGGGKKAALERAWIEQWMIQQRAAVLAAMADGTIGAASIRQGDAVPGDVLQVNLDGEDLGKVIA